MSDESPDPPKNDGEAEQPPAAADPPSQSDESPSAPPAEDSSEKAEETKADPPPAEEPPTETPESEPVPRVEVTPPSEPESEPAAPAAEEPTAPPEPEPTAPAAEEPPAPPEPETPAPAEEPPPKEEPKTEETPPSADTTKPEPPLPADEPSLEPSAPVGIELAEEKPAEDTTPKDAEPADGDKSDEPEVPKPEGEESKADSEKISEEESAVKADAPAEDGKPSNDADSAADTGKQPSEVSDDSEGPPKRSKSILVDELSKSRTSSKSVTVTDDVLEINPSITSLQRQDLELQEQAAADMEADLEDLDGEEEYDDEEEEEEEEEEEVPPLPPPKKRSRYNLAEPEDSDLPDDMIMQEDDRVWTLEKMKLSDRAGRSGIFVDEGPDAKNACRRSPSRTGGWVLEKMFENTCELKKTKGEFSLEKGMENLDMDDDGERRHRLSDESGGGPTSDLDDKAWELEKMYRTKGNKGGENRPENIARRSRCDFTNPSRTGGWVLEKLYRDGCPVKESGSDLNNEEKVVPEIKLDSNTLLRLDEENEKRWILEKMYRRNSKVQEGLDIAPTVCSAFKDENEGCDVDTRKVCRLARKLLIAYDSVTSCDMIGRLPTDQPEEMDDQRTFLEWVWDSFFGWTAVFKSKSGRVVVPDQADETIEVVDETASEQCV